MLDPKGKSRENSDNELDDADGVTEARNMATNTRNRISDVMIDTNLPIKLLFLVNAFKIDCIIENYKGNL